MLGLLGTTTNQQLVSEIPQLVVTKQTAGLIFWDDFNRADGAPGSPLVGGAWSADGNVTISASVLHETTDNAGQCDSTTISNQDGLVGYIFQNGIYLTANSGLTRTQRSGSQNTNEIRVGYEGVGVYPALRCIRDSVQAFVATGVDVSEPFPVLLRLVVQPSGSNGVSASLLTIENPTGGYGAMDLDFTSPDQDIHATGLPPSSASTGLDNQLYKLESRDNMFVCGNDITAVGLQTGYKMRLMGGAAVTRSVVVESSGTASLNVDILALPMDRLEILDSDDEIVGSFDSGSYIWGGDEFKVGE